MHSPLLPEELEKMGVLKDNIIVWQKNGIEFYYPPTVVEKIFGEQAQLSVVDDVVSANGIQYKKGELAEKVVAQTSAQTEMHPEFGARFCPALRKS